MKTKLKVGLDFAAPVPLHTDFSKGKFEGFEVDLMNRIAEELNLELDYAISYWKDILSDLQNEKIDVICSAATKTHTREQEFLLTRSYLDFHLCLVSLKSHLLRIDQLENARIGVRISTEAEDYLKEKYPGKKLIYFDSNEEIYDQLTNQEIDALVDDSPIAFGFTKDNSDLSISDLLTDTPSQYCIMLNKNNHALKQKLDERMGKFENESFMKELRQKWFNNQTL